MKIGVPKEIFAGERRVATTPDVVGQLQKLGFSVLVESGAGAEANYSDDAYRAAGCEIVAGADEVWSQADIIMKVRGPEKEEASLLTAGKTLICFLWPAQNPEMLKLLSESGATVMAMDSVPRISRAQKADALSSMGNIAGYRAVVEAAQHFGRFFTGQITAAGKVPPAKVLVIGGGVVGTHAAKIAAGMGADVTVLDRSIPRLRYLDDVFGGTFKNAYASAANTIELARQADMIIGAVLIPGAAAPKLISRAQLSELKPGAALVDVAIDQGGCFETSRATTHQDPIYEVDGIMHYCVANMPGAVARTSTIALGNATMPFMLALANKGWRQACEDDPHLLAGLNVHAGELTYYAVGKALGIDVIAPTLALKK